MKYTLLFSAGARRPIRYLLRHRLNVTYELRVPLFVAQRATPEWLEAWAAELDEQGDMPLEEYVSS